MESAEDNKELTDKFTGSEGRERRLANDVFRAQFRLVDELTDGALLMCIYPETNIKRSADVQAASNQSFRAYTETVSDHHLYEIGKEKRDFRITKKGVLHFAVNDIPLTRTNIKHIYEVYVDSLARTFPEQMKKDDVDYIKDWIAGWNVGSETDTIQITPRIKSIDSDLTNEWGRRGYPRLNYLFGQRPNNKAMLLNNELIYYFNKNFIDAWYVDNLGSLLIVVEKRKKP